MVNHRVSDAARFLQPSIWKHDRLLEFIVRLPCCGEILDANEITHRSFDD